jgi:uncharacterized protein DUF4279
LNSPVSSGNQTSLVFCHDKVDPDLVTQLLDLSPSEAQHVGDIGRYEWNGQQYVSHVGLWKLRLPVADDSQTVEDQLVLWVELLRPKSAALGRLRELGYSPYIDCKAESRSLSLCIDPEVLTALGALSVALSVWLYEQSPGDRSNASQLTHLQYRTGELILAGDVVEYHGDRGHVEYVVNGPTGHSEMDWNFRTNGTGVMVIEPKHFGRVYITDIENDEDLVFVSRTPDVKA